MYIFLIYLYWFFKFQVYEKQNVTRVKTWNKIDISHSNVKSEISLLEYDPNAELEWRNQAAAHTDCLLKYKVLLIFKTLLKHTLLF